MRKAYTHPAIDNEIKMYVATRKEVCPCCGGNGSHFRSDLDESRLIDSMDEDGDFDGLEAYRKGSYDQICERCCGRNVVDEIDWDSFRETYPNEYREIQAYEESARQDRLYEIQERRYLGCY